LRQLLRDQPSTDLDAYCSTLLCGSFDGLPGLGVGLAAHQIAQYREEVRHRFTSSRYATFDTADRDAFVGCRARLLDQLDKTSAAEMRRPPHVHGSAHRGLNVVGAESQRGTTHRGLDLSLVSRTSLGLPLTHLRNDTPEEGAEPLPQTPTQRPAGARLF
jgi:hypothetical protein